MLPSSGHFSQRRNFTATVLKKTGIVLIAIGLLWFVYVIFERYHDPMPEISPAFAAIALTTAFVGLLVMALGEVCRSLQAIETNTRKQA